jgi:hypothetical protein
MQLCCCLLLALQPLVLLDLLWKPLLLLLVQLLF